MAQVKLIQNNNKFLEFNCGQIFSNNLGNNNFKYISYDSKTNTLNTLFSGRKSSNDGFIYYIINIDLILNYKDDVLNLIIDNINLDSTNSNVTILLFSPIYTSQNKEVKEIFTTIYEKFKQNENVVIHSYFPRLNTLNKDNTKTLCGIIGNDLENYSNKSNKTKKLTMN